MKQDRPITLRGVKGGVTVRRMDNGHPHIQADEALDLY